tara:strand:- start:231 stop:455 length:225 start_codon:yes stop_codon:yes gene_type:complete
MYTFLHNEKITTITEEELQSAIGGTGKEDYIKALALTPEEIQLWQDRENYILIIMGKKIDLTKLYTRILKKLGI